MGLPLLPRPGRYPAIHVTVYKEHAFLVSTLSFPLKLLPTLIPCFFLPSSFLLFHPSPYFSSSYLDHPIDEGLRD